MTPTVIINGNSDTIFKERDLKLEQAHKRRRENNELKKAAYKLTYFKHALSQIYLEALQFKAFAEDYKITSTFV